ncbi:oxidoreductase [Paenibacillus gansuensis]|uniref:Oxidoreductase n=1 Tax=Paenibacillus gansuensis TaxID=306542 RepID=A0ABW5PGE7_9BACL
MQKRALRLASNQIRRYNDRNYLHLRNRDGAAMSKIALIAGASGLIGQELLQMLLNIGVYREVIALVRRELPLQHGKLRQAVVDFDGLDKLDRSVLSADDVFCCLGTTIKKAGSKEAMYRIDAEYPLALACAARSAGASQYIVVSSIGADANSSNFYLRTKGAMEEGLRAQGFAALHIMRPSLLLGERQEFRFGERAAAVLAKPLSVLLAGPLRKYRPVQASVVARAMLHAAQREPRGVSVHESETLPALAGRA